jgi:hypothetical protein
MQCVGSSLVEATDSDVDVGKVGPEVTVKDCGVAVARAAGEKLGTHAVNRLMVNVGKRRDKPPRCSEGRSRAVKVGEPYRPRAMGSLS